MKKITMGVLLLGILAGCAETVPYTGRVEYSERVMPPTAPHYNLIGIDGRVWSRIDGPTYGVFSIKNGTSDPLAIPDLYCNDAEYHDIIVEPRRQFDVLVMTTMGQANGGLCHE